MKKLTAFALGMVSVITVIPILESLTDLAVAHIESWKGNPIKRTLISNNEIADLQAQLEPVNSQVMGFSIPSGDEDYYDDDEFEDKGKIKVGFQIK